ncbi:MAG: hypothetical protein EXS37_12490 [Opitutus sp.]|nr:hypothetical protein [Opitutus sp.]
MFAATDIFDWVMGKLPVLIFVLVFVSQIVRGLMRSKSEAPPSQSKPDALEAQRHVAEVQEQIRRRIAERRSGQAPAENPPPVVRSEPLPPPMPRRVETTQMPEPFGGPLRRILEELQREAQPPPPPPPLPVPARPIRQVAESRAAELDRQEQLAEKFRVLEESRVLAKRRAAQLTDANYAEMQSEGGLRSAVRGHVLDDLRDPASLRRAFVLREVLGAPVGLR